MTKKTFNVETISDQKRLVRGEHWLLTRTLLRGRDKAHNKRWRLLIIAGPSPAEEIRCIRELMPKAEITAVDGIESHVHAAIDAGADDVICCDLADYTEHDRGPGQRWPAPPAGIDGTFDAICLDLTGPVSGSLEKMIRVYLRSLASRGVLIVTFSYGRDVVEGYLDHWTRNAQGREYFSEIDNMPEGLKQRLHMLLGTRGRYLRSCLQYHGKAMPMVSCLLQKEGNHWSDRPPVNFIAVGPSDFEAAVTADNLGNIYACPADRIIALRRSQAARKAVQTRKLRNDQQSSLAV